MPDCGRQLMYESSVDENQVPVLNPFIVNGENAEGREFPWQVSIQGPGNQHRCGASVLNHDFILSAAHFFLRLKEVSLFLSFHSISSSMPIRDWNPDQFFQSRDPGFGLDCKI